jgi:hypothetical protein
MTRTIFTHEHHNCGDQMIHLHLVRALAKERSDCFFTHFCNACHHENLREMIADLPNVLLVAFESLLWQERKHESVGVWKNFRDRWVNSPNRWDWSAYTLELHKDNARRMGFESPFSCRENLLFDYEDAQVITNDFDPGEFDFLIGDSQPCSGQFAEWADHSKRAIGPLIDALLEQRKYRIILTSQLKQYGVKVTEIGKISQRCRHHIMVANAPFFATLNTTNHHYHEGRKRIALLDGPEQLNMPHIIQMSSVDEVMRFAKMEGWL